MTIKLIKTANHKWDVTANGQLVGKCSSSQKHHGSYKVELNNGTVIHTFNQKTVKSMVAKNI